MLVFLTYVYHDTQFRECEVWQNGIYYVNEDAHCAVMPSVGLLTNQFFWRLGCSISWEFFCLFIF